MFIFTASYHLQRPTSSILDASIFPLQILFAETRLPPKLFVYTLLLIPTQPPPSRFLAIFPFLCPTLSRGLWPFYPPFFSFPLFLVAPGFPLLFFTPHPIWYDFPPFVPLTSTFGTTFPICLPLLFLLYCSEPTSFPPITQPFSPPAKGPSPLHCNHYFFSLASFSSPPPAP